MKIDYCDCHSDKPRPIKRLETGDGSGLFLCRKGWEQEMQFRTERNHQLASDTQFALIPWQLALEIED